MRALPLALLLLTALPADNALAHGHGASSATVNASCCDSPTRWASRHDSRDAQLAIVSEDGNATLLLTDEVVAIQLSDRALRDVKRELRDEEDQEDNALARAFLAVVLSGVRTLLDHSAECSIRDIRSVDYRHGRLVVTSTDGERLFDGLDVNKRDVLESFSERDAQQFAREFQRAKSRLR